VILVDVLRWLVLAFLLLLIGRLVLDWIQVFARDWRPKGPVLVVAEIIYSATDPPLKLLRRLIPPLRLGSVQLDLAFFILFLLTYVLLNVLQGL
jgi:YggT family protein